MNKKETEIESIIYQIIGYVSVMEGSPSLKILVKRLEKLLDAPMENDTKGENDDE